jgi:hypothetical protein
LYAVLFLQLVGMMASCMAGAEDATTTGPHRPVVNYYGIVVLSFGIATIYHETLKDCKLACLVVLVLLSAQILIIITLGDQSVAAEAHRLVHVRRRRHTNDWSALGSGSHFIYVIVVFVGNATLYR